MWMPKVHTSFNNPIKGMMSCRLIDRAMYSALVVDSAVMVCTFDAHEMGHPA